MAYFRSERSAGRPRFARRPRPFHPLRPILVFACGAPAASRRPPALSWLWKPWLGRRREGSLQTALLLSPAMPGSPTSGCAGCAIARPQGLHTGSMRNLVGIRPPSGRAVMIPRETGEAPAARQAVGKDSSGHFQAGSLCQDAGGRAEKPARSVGGRGSTGTRLPRPGG
jgi:hypothetical protein